jgi:hypothetical protein
MKLKFNSAVIFICASGVGHDEDKSRRRLIRTNFTDKYLRRHEECKASVNKN